MKEKSLNMKLFVHTFPFHHNFYLSVTKREFLGNILCLNCGSGTWKHVLLCITCSNIVSFWLVRDMRETMSSGNPFLLFLYKSIVGIDSTNCRTPFQVCALLMAR